MDLYTPFPDAVAPEYGWNDAYAYGMPPPPPPQEDEDLFGFLGTPYWKTDAYKDREGDFARMSAYYEESLGWGKHQKYEAEADEPAYFSKISYVEQHYDAQGNLLSRSDHHNFLQHEAATSSDLKSALHDQNRKMYEARRQLLEVDQALRDEVNTNNNPQQPPLSLQLPQHQPQAQPPQRFIELGDGQDGSSVVGQVEYIPDDAAVMAIKKRREEAEAMERAALERAQREEAMRMAREEAEVQRLRARRDSRVSESDYMRPLFSTSYTNRHLAPLPAAPPAADAASIPNKAAPAPAAAPKPEVPVKVPGPISSSLAERAEAPTIVISAELPTTIEPTGATAGPGMALPASVMDMMRRESNEDDEPPRPRDDAAAEKPQSEDAAGESGLELVPVSDALIPAPTPLAPEPLREEGPKKMLAVAKAEDGVGKFHGQWTDEMKIAALLKDNAMLFQDNHKLASENFSLREEVVKLRHKVLKATTFNGFVEPPQQHKQLTAPLSGEPGRTAQAFNQLPPALLNNRVNHLQTLVQPKLSRNGPAPPLPPAGPQQLLPPPLGARKAPPLPVTQVRKDPELSAVKTGRGAHFRPPALPAPPAALPPPSSPPYPQQQQQQQQQQPQPVRRPAAAPAPRHMRVPPAIREDDALPLPVLDDAPAPLPQQRPPGLVQPPAPATLPAAPPAAQLDAAVWSTPPPPVAVPLPQPAAQKAPGPAPFVPATQPFGLGILWMVRSDKLVIAGFMPGSKARDAGARQGDILRAVDQRDVLALKTGPDGSHPAQSMMLGPQNSICVLSVLRADINSNNTKLGGVDLAIRRIVPTSDMNATTAAS